MINNRSEFRIFLLNEIREERDGERREEEGKGETLFKFIKFNRRPTFSFWLSLFSFDARKLILPGNLGMGLLLKTTTNN